MNDVKGVDDLIIIEIRGISDDVVLIHDRLVVVVLLRRDTLVVFPHDVRVLRHLVDRLAVGAVIKPAGLQDRRGDIGQGDGRLALRKRRALGPGRLVEKADARCLLQGLAV